MGRRGNDRILISYTVSRDVCSCIWCVIECTFIRRLIELIAFFLSFQVIAIVAASRVDHHVHVVSGQFACLL